MELFPEQPVHSQNCFPKIILFEFHFFSLILISLESQNLVKILSNNTEVPIMVKSKSFIILSVLNTYLGSDPSLSSLICGIRATRGFGLSAILDESAILFCVTRVHSVSQNLISSNIIDAVDVVVDLVSKICC